MKLPGYVLVAGGYLMVASQLSVAENVELRMREDALCAEKDGHLVVLVNIGDDSQTAWVDRWFMNIQTPDHTRHQLAPGEEHALGCSNTRSGEQHWTITATPQ